MALPNVTDPVVISATTALVIQSDFFLRRVCFVSFGDSTLEQGEAVLVNSETYTSALAGDSSELADRLTQFFSYANNKECYILECGAQSRTALQDNYTNLAAYAASVNEDWEDEFNNYLYTDMFKDSEDIFKAFLNSRGDFSQDAYTAWLNKDQKADNLANLKLYAESEVSGFNINDYANWLTQESKDDTEDSLKAYLTANYAFVEQDYTDWRNIDVKPENLDTLKQYAKEELYIPLPDAYIAYLSANNADFQALKTRDNLFAFLQSEPGTYGADLLNQYTKWLYDNGVRNSDYSAKISAIKTQIDNGKVRIYIYALPKELTYYAELGTFLGLYADTMSQLYFAVELDKDENLASGKTSSYFTGLKSVIPIYNNGAKHYSAVGAFLGRFASAILDISDTNKASPLNFKTIAGFKYEVLSKQKEQEIIDYGGSFIGEMVGNVVILNGRTADLRPLDYWYQWDLTAYYIKEALITLLLQGVNNPNQVVTYDQHGIDVVNATITAQLNKMISYGCITEFASSLNPATNELENSGYIKAIPFYEYINSNPDDYTNEIYGGISFYVRIGKYIRLVKISASLG